jgi:methylase of polypeptide subunit release factors
VAKLLGSYEEELHPVIAHALRSRPSIFVDIGCADGYYAVGFAQASPATTILAFDISRTARELCGELAVVNGVEARVQIAGGVTDRSLRELPSGAASSSATAKARRWPSSRTL